MITTAFPATTRGRELLRHPHLNRVTTVTTEEPAALSLTGLLPAGVLARSNQFART